MAVECPNCARVVRPVKTADPKQDWMHCPLCEHVFTDDELDALNYNDV